MSGGFVPKRWTVACHSRKQPLALTRILSVAVALQAMDVVVQTINARRGRRITIRAIQYTRTPSQSRRLKR